MYINRKTLAPPFMVGDSPRRTRPQAVHFNQYKVPHRFDNSLRTIHAGLSTNSHRFDNSVYEQSIQRNHPTRTDLATPHTHKAWMSCQITNPQIINITYLSTTILLYTFPFCVEVTIIYNPGANSQVSIFN